MSTLTKQPNSRMCFVCGLQNPIGLQMAFYQSDDGECLARVTPGEEYEGYPGVLHGGIVTAILDETLGRTIIGGLNIFAVTAKFEVKFHHPVPTGRLLIARARITRQRTRAFEAVGELLLEDGTIAASASGVYIRLPEAEIDRARTELGFWEVVPDEEPVRFDIK